MAFGKVARGREKRRFTPANPTQDSCRPVGKNKSGSLFSCSMSRPTKRKGKGLELRRNAHLGLNESFLSIYFVEESSVLKKFGGKFKK